MQRGRFQGSLLLVLAACAAPATRPAATSRESPPARDASGTVVCRMERPTGSNIAERVCRTEEQAAKERAATQDALRAPRSGVPPQPGAKGR